MASRLRDLEGWLNPGFSPQHVARYLGIGSFEVAYPTLNDNSKRDLLRGALHMWGCYSAKADVKSEEWENTIQRLFALGASFELLCDGSGREEGPIQVKEGAKGDEVVVEVLRQFVAPYACIRAWFKNWDHSLEYSTQRFVEGFEYFVSKTAHLGIGLETRPSCERFEICIDDRFNVWTGTLEAAKDCLWKPHGLSLYYDAGLSTWVMWDSMYEEWCGEFWDLIDHPQRTMPGIWID